MPLVLKFQIQNWRINSLISPRNSLCLGEDLQASKLPASDVFARSEHDAAKNQRDSLGVFGIVNQFPLCAEAKIKETVSNTRCTDGEKNARREDQVSVP